MSSSKTSEAGKIESGMGIALREIGIPPRPLILLEIDNEMAKDGPDFSHLAKILGEDVALAAALLKTANSPFFGFQKKVRSVREALLVLGLKLVVRTVASIELKKSFKHVPGMERFWDASATNARVSGWLAQRLRKCCWIRVDDAYTFGLFRDCGIPLLMTPFPEYREVLARANQEKVAKFTDIENESISTNHAEMGAMMAESWLLPEEITEAIRHHHDLVSLSRDENLLIPPIVLPLIAISQLAEYLIHEKTGMGGTQEWDKMAAAIMNILSLDEAKLAELSEESHEVVADEDD